jgi:lytic murein transglycosylase
MEWLTPRALRAARSRNGIRSKASWTRICRILTFTRIAWHDETIAQGESNMLGRRFATAFGALVLTPLLFAAPASAARCGGDFNTFVSAMSAEAAAAGISQGVVSQAFAGVTQDPAVLSFDRRQRGTFNKSFEQYVSTRVGAGRISIGLQMLQRHAALLSRIEQRFGVPPQIVVAIWGLESDFGRGDIGKMPVIRTLTTMAHDCRRTELFQGELLAALKILQRGDLPQRDLIGAFAGEIGQTQFLPSSYIKYGVDFDGNGHVDLRHSVPDVLASTANLLHSAGFKNGAPYGEGTANFEAMREWNRATIYRKTIAYFADRLSQGR